MWRRVQESVFFFFFTKKRCCILSLIISLSDLSQTLPISISDPPLDLLLSLSVLQSSGNRLSHLNLLALYCNLFFFFFSFWNLHHFEQCSVANLLSFFSGPINLDVVHFILGWLAQTIALLRLLYLFPWKFICWCYQLPVSPCCTFRCTILPQSSCQHLRQQIRMLFIHANLSQSYIQPLPQGWHKTCMTPKQLLLFCENNFVYGMAINNFVKALPLYRIKVNMDLAWIDHTECSMWLNVRWYKRCLYFLSCTGSETHSWYANVSSEDQARP